MFELESYLIPVEEGLFNTRGRDEDGYRYTVDNLNFFNESHKVMINYQIPDNQYKECRAIIKSFLKNAPRISKEIEDRVCSDYRNLAASLTYNSDIVNAAKYAQSYEDIKGLDFWGIYVKFTDNNKFLITMWGGYDLNKVERWAMGFIDNKLIGNFTTLKKYKENCAQY